MQSVLSRVELRDLARMDGLAKELQRQTGHLRRNMADHDTHDRSRFLLMQNIAAALLQVADRCERRYLNVKAERKARR